MNQVIFYTWFKKIRTLISLRIDFRQNIPNFFQCKSNNNSHVATMSITWKKGGVSGRRRNRRKS